MIMNKNKRSRSTSRVRKFRSRSRSTSRIRKLRSRSTSRVRKFRSRTRSRSTSRVRKFRSRSRSPSRVRNFISRSPSRVRNFRSRSRSPSRVTKFRSRSRSTSRVRTFRSRSASRVRKFRSRSKSTSRIRMFRSRSKSRPYKSRLSRSRSRSKSRYKKSRSRSKSRYKKSRSRSKSRCKRIRLSRSRSNSRSHKSRSKSISKPKSKKSRSSRSRSTSRKRKNKSSRSRSSSTHRKYSKRSSRSTSVKRGVKEQPKRRSRSKSISSAIRDENKEMVSSIKKESDKSKKVLCKAITSVDDDDDLQEIPVEPVTPPPVVDLASESDEEVITNQRRANSQESSFNNEEFRIPLNFSNKNVISIASGSSSNRQFNEIEPVKTLSQVSISDDLLMPLTFGRKQPQSSAVSLAQHQTVDLTENNSDMEQIAKNMTDKEAPSVYDMEHAIGVGDTTIDLNLAKTAFLDSAIIGKYGEKLPAARKIEGVIEPDSESLFLKDKINLTPLKLNLDKPKVILSKSPSIKNVNEAEDVNYIVKRRTAGKCVAAHLREGEIVSKLRILHEMGGEMGILRHPISAIYNQLLQLQNEGDDPRKYLNQNKDASDILNLVKSHLKSCLEDGNLGAVQRVVQEELQHLISDIVNGTSSPIPVEVFTCYGIRTDVLACSMLDEDPEEIKEFIHNTLVYEGIYEPTEEIVSTIFKAIEKVQKQFQQDKGCNLELLK